MNKTISLVSAILMAQLVMPSVAIADPSMVTQSTLRSSTQSINRTVQQNVSKALGKYRTRSNLNMRSEPKGEVIRTLPKGAQVVVVEKSNGPWWQVSNDNQLGWVHSGYLVKNKR